MKMYSISLLTFLAALKAGAEVPATISAEMKNRSILSGFIACDDPVMEGKFGMKDGRVSIDANTEYNLRTKRIREIDLETMTALMTGTVNISLYAGYFAFPNTGSSDAQELGFSISGKQSGFDLSSYLGKISGPETNNGHIIKINTGRSINITPRSALDINVGGAFNEHYFNPSSGITHVSETANYNFALDKNTSISAKAYYQQATNTAHFGSTFRNTGNITLGIKQNL